MVDILDFILIMAPAGLVLAHSLVESRHRSQQLEDMAKHNTFMLQMTTREMLAHLKTQDEVITKLRQEVKRVG